MNMRAWALGGLFCFAGPVHAASTDVICTYAPSQHGAVQSITQMTTGAARGTQAVLVAAGMNIVKHSSKLPILAGKAGYVAGSIPGAVTATTIITAAVIVAGVAVTVELACAPINHPELVAKIDADASRYATVARNTFDSLVGEVEIETVSSQEKLRAKVIDIVDQYYKMTGERWHEYVARKARQVLNR